MNIRKIIYLNCGETYEDMIDHCSYAHNLSSCEIKAWKKQNSGLNGIRTHDLCDTGAVLYQLSYQANSGFESRSGLYFFQAFICVHNCGDQSCV